MSYIIVTADFPGTDPDQRAAIYEELEKEQWSMAQDPGAGMGTIWYAAAESNLSETEFIKTAIHHFATCSQPYCNPRLTLQLTPAKPTFASLMQGFGRMDNTVLMTRLLGPLIG
jgi:hypothetical protein